MSPEETTHPTTALEVFSNLNDSMNTRKRLLEKHIT